MKKFKDISVQTLIIIITSVAVVITIAAIWLGEEIKDFSYKEALKKEEERLSDTTINLDDYTGQILSFLGVPQKSAGYAVITKDEESSVPSYSVKEYIVDDVQTQKDIFSGKINHEELMKSDKAREVDSFGMDEVEESYLDNSLTGRIVGTKTFPSVTSSTTSRDFEIFEDIHNSSLMFGKYDPVEESHSFLTTSYFKLYAVENHYAEGEYESRDVSTLLWEKLNEDIEEGDISLRYDEEMKPTLNKVRN